MRGKTILARTGAAVLGASMALMAGALPAGADQATPAGANKAQGKLEAESSVKGYNVDLGKGYTNIDSLLFGIRLNGGELLQVYCVEIKTETRADANMVERPWDQFPNENSPFHENRGKINWVLHHGYPSIEVADLQSLLAEKGTVFTDGLDEREAITATQAAVWHFSDGKDLNRTDPLPAPKPPKDKPNAPVDEAPPGSEEDVLALYDYLVGAKNVGNEEHPTPTLDISPEKVSGETGGRVGPFTVSTTGDITEIVTELPEGVQLTDSEGNELAPEDITNGTDVYFDVPADAAEGSGLFELTTNGVVDTGRLFVAEDYDDQKAQSLIVASSEEVSLSDGAKGSWSVAPIETGTPEEEETSTPAAPTTETGAPTTQAPVNPQSNEDDLAQTGFSALTPLLLGGGLLVAGGATLLLLRRRSAR